jgi:hypothetical protein
VSTLPKPLTFPLTLEARAYMDGPLLWKHLDWIISKGLPTCAVTPLAENGHWPHSFFTKSLLGHFI